MNIVKATRKFEEWLSRHTQVLKDDIALKHQEMASAAFPFLRATFYRWAQAWPEICDQLAKAPSVLAVGDLHIENFGTWRDAEGRLIWGVNDFDEAAEMPYTNDLIRLAASSLLAIEAGKLALKAKPACDAILEGYEESLSGPGRPFILEENHGWLRNLASSELRDPAHFWKKMDSLQPPREAIPLSARAALEHLLPGQDLDYRVVRRVSGLGSLGRVRLVALTDWHGGRIAREAKALVASAVFWQHDSQRPPEIMCQVIASQAARCPDPFFQIRDRWILRRLSPHCCRIELSDLPKQRDELRLLHAMGWETANIHQGSGKAVKQVRRHWKSLKRNWLASAAEDMARSVMEDWKAWRKDYQS
jgi:Uncharacterized protein conserved in bacteria (DUF2252)